MRQTAIESHLEWFLDFVNLDIPNLKTTDRLKVKLDLADALRIPVIVGNLDAPLNPEWRQLSLFNDDTVALMDLQNHLKSILLRLHQKLTQIEEDSRSHKTAKVSPERYLALTRLEPIPLTLSLTLSIEFADQPEITSVGKHGKETPQVDLGSLLFSDSYIEVRANSQDINSLMTYHFFQALRGLPSGSLRRCLQCEKWFVKMKLRNRIFCSSACATKKANKDRYMRIKAEWSEPYHEELRQGRVRAKKSYEQKQRKKT